METTTTAIKMPKPSIPSIEESSESSDETAEEAEELRVGQTVNLEGVVSDRIHISSLALDRCRFIKVKSIDE